MTIGECIGSATPRPSGQFANVPNAVDNVDSQPQSESNTNSKPTNNEGNQPNVHSEGVTPMGRKGNQVSMFYLTVGSQINYW